MLKLKDTIEQSLWHIILKYLEATIGNDLFRKCVGQTKEYLTAQIPLQEILEKMETSGI